MGHDFIIKASRGIASTLLLASIAMPASAGVINGGSLLGSGDADQLEAWMGIGDQDFTNIWSGTSGVSTATDFHAAVDGAGATISIYDITIHDGSSMRIGGFTNIDWGSASGSYGDSDAFIFNLDSLELQQLYDSSSLSAIMVYDHLFPTFGSGHDITGGSTTLGNGAFTYSSTYGQDQGRIDIADDGGGASGDSGTHYTSMTFNSLEVFTFSNAAVTSVPEPSVALLFGIGLAGLGLARRKRTHSTST